MKATFPIDQNRVLIVGTSSVISFDVQNMEMKGIMKIPEKKLQLNYYGTLTQVDNLIYGFNNFRNVLTYDINENKIMLL